MMKFKTTKKYELPPKQALSSGFIKFGRNYNAIKKVVNNKADLIEA